MVVSLCAVGPQLELVASCAVSALLKAQARGTCPRAYVACSNVPSNVFVSGTCRNASAEQFLGRRRRTVSTCASNEHTQMHMHQLAILRSFPLPMTCHHAQFARISMVCAELGARVGGCVEDGRGGLRVRHARIHRKLAR